MKSNLSILRLFISIIITFICIFHIGYSQLNENKPTDKIPQFEIAGSQVLKINSAITGQPYVLYVSLPQRYSDTTKSFPVIYVLDGQWDFTIITAIYGAQYYDGFLPNAIIVAITWGGENPNYDKRRAFDLTPTDGGQPLQYGNAEKFLSFIKNEAIPFIESKYRVQKNERTLVGQSLGGLFTLYALFTETSLFNKYVPASPAWARDNASIYKFADKFSKTNLSRLVRIYMSVGEYEDVAGFEKLVSVIKEYKMEGLKLESQVIKGSGHAGTKPEGYNRGLQFVFEKPTVIIKKEILDQYVGEYEINPQVIIRIEREGDRLVGIIPNNPKIYVNAETEKDFYLKGSYFFLHFQKDDSGKVTGFQFEQYTGGASAKKIK